MNFEEVNNKMLMDIERLGKEGKNPRNI